MVIVNETLFLNIKIKEIRTEKDYLLNTSYIII